MHVLRRTLIGATVLLTAAGTAVVSAGASGPTLPQAAAASSAATWLAGQLTPGGYIAGSTVGSANLPATVNTVLALAATDVDPSGARAGLHYLSKHVATYVTAQGSDGPGQLALLILAAHALGASATSFGGNDLVTDLLATEQSNGRFGTNAQVSAYNSGPYDQGLALAALAAAGDQLGGAALPVSWLRSKQCIDGGWTAPSTALNPCNGSPADYQGPDTNTTSLAIQGLAAQTGGLTGPVTTKARAFLAAAQDADAGWGYEPNTAADPGTTDPDSTSLVLQALVALGQLPASASGSHSPVSTLLTFQITSGRDRGAIAYTVGSTGNLLATYQTVPALAGVALPYTTPPAPTVTSISPRSGPHSGGTAVTVSGTNLRGVVSVSFGAAGDATSVTSTSSTTLIATAPAWADAGAVTIVVTTLGGPSVASSGSRFTYLATP